MPKSVASMRDPALCHLNRWLALQNSFFKDSCRAEKQWARIPSSPHGKIQHELLASTLALQMASVLGGKLPARDAKQH